MAKSVQPFEPFVGDPVLVRYLNEGAIVRVAAGTIRSADRETGMCDINVYMTLKDLVMRNVVRASPCEADAPDVFPCWPPLPTYPKE